MNIESIGIDCVGCGSCVNSCPYNAISLKYDEEGFIYPDLIHNKCVDCNLCIKHCPQQSDSSELGHIRTQQQSYAAYSLFKKKYKKSASGGAFVTLAWNFFHKYNDAIVCGATFSEGKVHHIIIDKPNDLPLLQGSKYVQSQLDNVYNMIKEHLKSGGHTLFSGTPCQVAGLYAFLGNKEIDKLLTIDIICHGVPSPLFFEKDMTLYAKDIHDLQKIEFRLKHPIYKSKSQYCLYVEKKSQKRSALALLRGEYVFLHHDPYYLLFSKGWSLRKSCYQCHYANLQRVGDITIGDCDSYSNYPTFHPNEATSVVIVNTIEGERIWVESKNLFESIIIDLQKEALVNQSLKQSVKKPIERNTIYTELKEKDIKYICSHYAKPQNLWYYAGCLLYMTISPQLSNKLVALYRKLDKIR